MTEPDFQLLGRLIREMQADMRTIRSENALLHQHFASGFAQLASVLNDRIAAFEVIVEGRFDQSERSLEERLTRIEDLLKPK